MNKKIKFIFTLLMFSTLIYGGDKNRHIGGSSMQFLKLGKSAKAVGLGDAYSAISEDVSAMFYNPAGVYGKKQWSAMFVYSRIYTTSGANLLNMAGKYKIGKVGDFGLGLSILLPGKQVGTKVENGQILETGEFNSPSFEIIANYSRGILSDHLMLGANLKTAIESLGGGSLDGGLVLPKFVADVGLIFNFGLLNPMMEVLNLGFTLNQIGVPEKNGGVAYPLPITMKTGLSYLLWINSSHEFLFVGEAEQVKYENFTFTLGTKYSFKRNLDVFFAYKIGEGLYGINGGVGYRQKNFSINYSFDFVELDIMNRIEVSFGMPVKKKEASVEAIYFTGQKYFGQKKYKEALKYFNHALSIKGEHIDSKKRIEEINDILVKEKRLKIFENAMMEIK